MNCLQALRHEKSRMMAVGVLKSLAAAMDDGDRRPWRVSSSGKEMVGREMTPLWFDSEFPKDTGTRPRKTVNPAPPLLTTATAPTPLPSPTLPTLSPMTPTPSLVTSAPVQPTAAPPAPAVSAQSEAPATDETDEADSSMPSPEEPLTLETLVTRSRNGSVACTRPPPKSANSSATSRTRAGRRLSPNPSADTRPIEPCASSTRRYPGCADCPSSWRR